MSVPLGKPGSSQDGASPARTKNENRLLPTGLGMISTRVYLEEDRRHSPQAFSPFSPGTRGERGERGERFGMMPAIAQKSTRTPWDEFGNRAVVGSGYCVGLEFPQTG